MDIKITDNSREFIEGKDAAIRKFLEEAGLHLEGQAAKELENDPRRVDTGLLRNSITHALDGESTAKVTYQSNSVDKNKNPIPIVKGRYVGTTPAEPKGSAAVYVGTNVEYAPYVHEGTLKMLPNRFLVNAFERNRDQIQKKLKEALKGG